ncbi:MAG: hypothetical protein MUO63_15970 [Desulfobulbaceae bacterium]|nr:hypothetical protein [Desulfobulbaceae bacterium]
MLGDKTTFWYNITVAIEFARSPSHGMTMNKTSTGQGLDSPGQARQVLLPLFITVMQITKQQATKACAQRP